MIFSLHFCPNISLAFEGALHLLRCTIKEVPIRSAIYDVATKITIVNNEKVIKVFERDYNNDFTRKFYFTKYGSTIFNEIENIIFNGCKRDAKIFMGLNSEKIVITVGYNSTVEQRQIQVLESILNNSLIIKYKDLIQFAFPMTYGGNKKNINDIKQIMEKSNYEYKIFENFLNDYEVANLRFASDIFIHLATTDVMCSSMRGYMLAKNLVITGDWLPYNSLLEDGFYFDTVKNIVEIGDKVIYWLSNYNEIEKYISNNDIRLKDGGDWDVFIKDWIKLYNSVLEKNKEIVTDEVTKITG